MTDPAAHEHLVDALVDSLRPVRRLASPSTRAFVWIGLSGGAGLVLSPFVDWSAFWARMAVPDLGYAALGAALTAVTAALAAFQTSVPGRSSFWALLPLPSLTVWVGASGLGCLREWVVPGTDIPDAREISGCFAFLMAASIPLSVLMALMLRRACPLRPKLTAMLGGLAVAAVAAVLLVPFHPHDATATDLAIHFIAVLIVIGVNGLAGGRLFDATRTALKKR